ncbi:hypothetical protein LTR02_002646 [Friedmanniomyces endolithicus]|nr:hypothetical protein LTR02_002646 [Friedmanniomyces endolithicus]
MQSGNSSSGSGSSYAGNTGSAGRFYTGYSGSGSGGGGGTGGIVSGSSTGPNASYWADLREDEHLADVLALRARVLHAVSDWMCYYFGAVRGGLDGLEERVVWAMALMLVDDDDDGDDDDDDDDFIVYYLRERWTKALGRLAAGDHGGKDSGVFLETGGEWRKWVAQFAGSTEKAPETLDFITRLPWT